jgi:hypothetical protein
MNSGLPAAIAAYNTKRENVENSIAAGRDVDERTTGHNYSRDVLARMAAWDAWYKWLRLDAAPDSAWPPRNGGMA